MKRDKEPTKNPEANIFGMSKLKKMRSEGYLLTPTSTLEELEPLESLSDVSGSQKSRIKIKAKQTPHSGISQLSSSRMMSFSDLKQFLEELLGQKIVKIKNNFKEQWKRQIVQKQVLLKDCKQWKDYLTSFFECSLFLGSSENSLTQIQHSDLKYMIGNPEKRRITIEAPRIRGKSKSKVRKYQQFQSQNQQLRKELGQSKIKIVDLEKKVLRLIEQYKERKEVYQKEISKLTQIIHSSIKRIPELIFESHQNQKAETPDKHQLLNIFPEKKDQYNELSLQNSLFFSSISALSKRDQPQVEKNKKNIERLPTFTSLTK